MGSGKKNLNNKMRELKVHKLVLNCCVGEPGDRLTRAGRVLEQLTGQTPVFSKSRLTIRSFGIRRNDKISTSVTVRGNKAEEILERGLKVKEFELQNRNFSDTGNFGFGINEHIDLGIKVRGARGDREEEGRWRLTRHVLVVYSTTLRRVSTEWTSTLSSSVQEAALLSADEQREESESFRPCRGRMPLSGSRPSTRVSFSIRHNEAEECIKRHRNLPSELSLLDLFGLVHPLSLRSFICRPIYVSMCFLQAKSQTDPSGYDGVLVKYEA